MGCFIQKETAKHIIKEITTLNNSSPSKYRFCIILACSCTVRTVSNLHNKQHEGIIWRNASNGNYPKREITNWDENSAWIYFRLELDLLRLWHVFLISYLWDTLQSHACLVSTGTGSKPNPIDEWIVLLFTLIYHVHITTTDMAYIKWLLMSAT